MYEGLELEVLVDIRDVEESLYSLEIIDGTNKATMKMPLIPAMFRKDKTQHENRITDNEVKKAHNALRSKFSKRKLEEQT